MKKILTAIIACNLFFACTNSQSESTTETKEEKKVTKRDLGITRAVAYSNLFMDSITMEKFITTKKLSDSVARRMRSFYNARNYQFAWFSSDGLTEQARGFWNLHDYINTYDTDSSLKDKALQKTMDRLPGEPDFIPF